MSASRDEFADAAGMRMDPAVGLCSVCQHAERVRSGKGSIFWLCGLSRTDPRFRKYPPLPVVRCSGFKAIEPSA